MHVNESNKNGLGVGSSIWREGHKGGSEIESKLTFTAPFSLVGDCIY